jgi:ABC-type dipeptide/oligopeptide/nickel transport system permease subunit
VLPAGTLQEVTLAGNVARFNQQGFSTPSVVQAPSILPNIPLGGTALTGFDTNGRVSVAGTWYIAEIQVPATMLVTGISVLNGTTVGTDK